MKFVYVQDSESGEWRYAHPVPHIWRDTYTPGGRKKGRRSEQPNYIYPIPEHISAFVKAHRIVEAETPEEGLCQILNSK